MCFVEYSSSWNISFWCRNTWHLHQISQSRTPLGGAKSVQKNLCRGLNSEVTDLLLVLYSGLLVSVSVSIVTEKIYMTPCMIYIFWSCCIYIISHFQAAAKGMKTPDTSVDEAHHVMESNSTRKPVRSVFLRHIFILVNACSIMMIDMTHAVCNFIKVFTWLLGQVSFVLVRHKFVVFSWFLYVAELLNFIILDN